MPCGTPNVLFIFKLFFKAIIQDDCLGLLVVSPRSVYTKAPGKGADLQSVREE